MRLPVLVDDFVFAILWSKVLWSLSWPSSLNVLPQIPHIYSHWPKWLVSTCCLYSAFELNRSGHCVHLLLWKVPSVLKWDSKSLSVDCWKPQCMHSCFLFSCLKTRSIKRGVSDSQSNSYYCRKWAFLGSHVSTKK